MIKGIDHIGLATDDPTALAPFLTALGLRRDDAAVAEDYGVSCEFWSHPAAGGQPAVELVAPVRSESAVTDRLAKQGPGLYHLAFEVDELEPELARLRGCRLRADRRHPVCRRPAGHASGLHVPAQAGRHPDRTRRVQLAPIRRRTKGFPAWRIRMRSHARAITHRVREWVRPASRVEQAGRPKYFCVIGSAE